MHAGTITYAGTAYTSISSFALLVIKERKPHRRACDGWKEVSIAGVKLSALRQMATGMARQPPQQQAEQLLSQAEQLQRHARQLQEQAERMHQQAAALKEA